MALANETLTNMLRKTFVTSILRYNNYITIPFLTEHVMYINIIIFVVVRPWPCFFTLGYSALSVFVTSKY